MSTAYLAQSAHRARLGLCSIRLIQPSPSSTLRYWNLARQRYCRPSARYDRATPVSRDRAPVPPRTPARKARLLDVRGNIPRDTDCPLEESGFELLVPP